LPGVGKKTAERLIIEMKDRLKRLGDPMQSLTSLSQSASYVVNSQQTVEFEAISALTALGYKPQEASKMVRKSIRPNIDSETLIKEALKAAL
ncbi:MAG: Holliday junction branch migration protein RuvA, partial [Candidatus Schmidhempelia sp.]|nr:Holliday junction branch migration protein RuvA [Candidatus Schmidhempelia sp.]